MNQQYCPICKSEVAANLRYPNYICNDCLSDGVLVNGTITSTNELDIYTNDEISCEVKGVKCKAQEAHFGGVVVQII